MNQRQAAPRAVSAFEQISRAIINAAGWRRFALAFVAGLAGALALAPVYALPLMAVSFSVLILLLDGAVDAPRSKPTTFALGWFFGFGYFLAGLYWMAFSFFVQADAFAWMAPLAVMGIPAVLGLFSGAACLLAGFFWRPGWRRIVLFAAIWTLSEYARGHVLTGLPWNLAGQALAGSAVSAQTAAWYGAYGLSLVAVAIASAPAAWLGAGLPARRVFLGVGVSIGASAALFAIGALRLALPEPAPSNENFVRIVQPNIPQREKINPDFWRRNFNRQLALSVDGLPAKGRVFVIWPENGAPLLNEARSALDDLSVLPANAVLLAGAVRRETGADGGTKFYNSIAITPHTAQGRQVVTFYDKHHLVPFGEYLPLQGVLQAVGLAQLAPYEDGFTAGQGPRVMNAGGPSFAPLICYEVIFPGALYPRGERPQWLLTVTNDAWFGDTSGPRQHLDMARLRAIESGLPMARAANTGISALIDAKGRILERVPLYEAGRIDAALPRAAARTLYDRFGDWLFLTMIVLCFAAAFTRIGGSRSARS